ncbi:predicted protein [Histoplasma mississippiense (nom. inval.)]|uniref:predicted protein n=1 Tax=Ajellomyces capsulatus (strain NAm1 / WU24) TaxID=2059318 RepID=UPI000157CF3B|nr:predicted protein [Histoplasma mississippiense (nom. inval.)]EDN04396.1 predicted protein [Histoplasma mississippiense (nom. inval.)]
MSGYQGSATGARKASPYMSTADDEQTGITSGVYEEDGRSDAESESDSSSLDDTDAKEVVAKELAKLDLNTSEGHSVAESEAILIHTATLHEFRLSDRAVSPKSNRGGFSQNLSNSLVVLKFESLIIWVKRLCGVSITSEILILETVKALRLPQVELGVQFSLKLSQAAVRFPLLEDAKNGVLDIGLSPTEFQLSHAAPFFDRNMYSAREPLVHDFEPDKWQREVLDEIDANRSLFYAMKKILGEDYNSVLVSLPKSKLDFRSPSSTVESLYEPSIPAITASTTLPAVKF